jgi:hypothetical protein
VMTPPDLIPLAFGNDSFRPHLAAASAAGIDPQVLRLEGIGLDEPIDLKVLARYARIPLHRNISRGDRTTEGSTHGSKLACPLSQWFCPRGGHAGRSTRLRLEIVQGKFSCTLQLFHGEHRRHLRQVDTRDESLIKIVIRRNVGKDGFDQVVDSA